MQSITHRFTFVGYRAAVWLIRHPWLLFVVAAGVISPADAATCGSSIGFSGFTGLLGSIASFLTGDFGRAILIVAIAITGALMAFGELKGLFGTGIKILFGGALILGAASFAGLFTSISDSSTVCSYITNG